MPVRSTWQRWAMWREHRNMVLLLVSLIALTRGVVYTIPTRERIPRGLDLLPRESLSLYGVLWLAAACYGLSKVRLVKEQRLARRYLGGMATAWAVIYFAASAFPDADRVALIVTGVFYLLIAAVAWASKPHTVTEYKTVYIVHGDRDEAPFVAVEPDVDGGAGGDHAGT